MDRALTLLMILLVVFAAAPVIAGEPPPPVGDHVDPHGHGYRPVRVRHLEKIEWKWTAGAHTGRAVPSPDGLLRIQGGGGTIHCVDPDTGKMRWRVAGNTRFFNYSSCVVGPDNVAYGGNHGFLQAVGPDGKTLWRTGLKASWIHRPPAVSPDGKTLYLGSDGIGLASLDARTGEVNWLRREFGSPWTAMVFDDEGRLIVGWPKRIVCFEPNGAEAWSQDGTAKHLLFVPGRLIVGGLQTVAALDPTTRKSQWTVDLGSRVAGLALGDDGLLVASLDSGELVALEPGGRIRWRMRISAVRLSRPVTVRGGETLVMDRTGRLSLVSGGGRVLESIETGESFWRWRPSVGPDGRVYVNHQNSVLCIGGAERPAGEGGDFEVLSAQWGTGHRWVDVTDQARALATEAGLDVAAVRKHFGDPYPRFIKSLVVFYRWRGEVRSVAVREDHRLRIPFADAKEAAAAVRRAAEARVARIVSELEATRSAAAGLVAEAVRTGSIDGIKAAVEARAELAGRLSDSLTPQFDELDRLFSRHRTSASDPALVEVREQAAAVKAELLGWVESSRRAVAGMRAVTTGVDAGRDWWNPGIEAEKGDPDAEK